MAEVEDEINERILGEVKLGLEVDDVVLVAEGVAEVEVVVGEEGLEDGVPKMEVRFTAVEDVDAGAGEGPKLDGMGEEMTVYVFDVVLYSWSGRRRQNWQEKSGTRVTR